MKESRRSFLKKAAVAGSVAAVSTVAASAKDEATYSSNGVVVGHSPKKEILYKKTKAWDDFYRSAQ
ncbi:twin-arginine translocation signal domain-containing protein [Sulfurospirillum sp. 1307]|jgi:hypothetical protein